MAGLNTDPATDSTFASIDYAWYLAENGNAAIFENGREIGTFVYGFGLGTFQVIYDNKMVRYLYNGAQYHSTPAPQDLTLYFDAALAGTVGFSRLEDVNFAAAGSAGADGANGKDGTNGTDGRDGTDGRNGTDGKNGAPGRNAIIFQQDAVPANPVVGDTWVTITAPRIFRKWDGANWVKVLGNVSELDMITANYIAVENLAAINANLGTMVSIAEDGSKTTITGFGMVQHDPQCFVIFASGNLSKLGVL